MRRKDPFRELSSVAVSVYTPQVSVLFRKEKEGNGGNYCGQCIIQMPLQNHTVVKEIPGEPLPWSGREIAIY